jgi:hypothetical protein
MLRTGIPGCGDRKGLWNQIWTCIYSNIDVSPILYLIVPLVAGKGMGRRVIKQDLQWIIFLRFRRKACRITNKTSATNSLSSHLSFVQHKL